MRLGPDTLACPQAGEHVAVLQRPDGHSDVMEIAITLANVGSGPGPHLHPAQVEQFVVVRGRVEVLVGQRLVLAGPEEEVTVPAGTTHRFQSLDPATQLRARIMPGHGFEAALEDVYTLFDRGQLRPEGPVDADAVAACFAKHKDVMVSMRGHPRPLT